MGVSVLTGRELRDELEHIRSYALSFSHIETYTRQTPCCLSLHTMCTKEPITYLRSWRNDKSRRRICKNSERNQHI